MTKANPSTNPSTNPNTKPINYTILDCYTDEASGLGVPPYLATYARYIYAQLTSEGHSVKYLTIDDLRLYKKYDNIIKPTTVKDKTNIKIYNLTNNKADLTLANTDKLIVLLGVHVPGKYLSALPGTLKEITPLLRDIKIPKILTGPAIFGTQLEGGKFFEHLPKNLFSEIKAYGLNFNDLKKYAAKGAELLEQIPEKRMIEIETGRGCKVGKCSFCTEPIKSKFQNRKMEDVLEEVIAYYKAGARFFRLGKQADFYASDRPIELLKQIRKHCKDIEVLHIDNVNPNSVVRDKDHEITKAIVKYCTEGNIAAFGVESFDPIVVKENLLNTAPIIAHKAIEIINKYGAIRGPNGMHKYLPGINIIFGLLGESKKTHKANMDSLLKIIDQGLLLRRINVRQVAVLPDTYLEKHGGDKFLRKNKKYYWKWRNDIRQKIDNPMLKLLVPTDTIINDVYTEIYDGKTTFARQIGTYPLTIGIKGRIPLKEKISVKVTKHMLRSITAELVE